MEPTDSSNQAGLPERPALERLPGEEHPGARELPAPPVRGSHIPRLGMRAVAERAGVAMSSVSRVLSGHPDVSEQMQERVMAAVDELGYRRDLLAQGLRSRRTYTIGFTLSDIANPVLAEAVTGAEHRLREAGYSLLITDADGSAELDAEHIARLDQRRVDGFLLSLADEHDEQVTRVLADLEQPLVLLDRDRPEGVDALSVQFDHAVGMSAAAAHLLELGHRHIALIIGGPRRPARERREAIERTLADHGGGRLDVYEGDFCAEYGRHAVSQLREHEPRTTAIVAAGNQLMLGALIALRGAGVRLGVDMSFVGCDDLAITELHDPPVAVVRRDNRALGALGAELLLDELAGLRPPRERSLPTEFLPRESCGPAPHWPAD